METRQEITTTIKEQADIVQIIGEFVELKRSGVRYLGLCPFHGEKTPSFSVNGSEQFYYCFGCGESGDVFSFLMKYHNYDFPTALKHLADRLNIQLPDRKITSQDKEREKRRHQMFEVTKKVAKIYQNCLANAEKGRGAQQYLENRGISLEARNRFGIGYAPSKEMAGWNFLGSQLSAEEEDLAEQVGLLVKNDRGGRYDRFRDRIVFPIYDIQGRICGFGGRIIGEGQPKYMNSPESYIFNKSKNLLGLYQQRDEIRRRRKAVLVEGNFDMISLVDHDFENVVAPLGTALTASQVRLLGRYAEEVTLLFDGDEAGLKAAVRAAPHFLKEKVHARVATLPPKHDPDTFVRQEGRDALIELLNEAKDLSEFVLAQLVEEHGLTLEGKSRIVEEIQPLISSASSSLQRSVMVAHFAEKLGIEARHLEATVVGERASRTMPEVPRRVQQSGSGSAQPLTPAQKRLVEFMIMHPHFFQELESRDLRKVLQGGVGEILFLQLKMMLAEGKEVQPEDIFAALPEGAERNLVADILMSASSFEAGQDDSDPGKEELKEMIDWLDMQLKRNISKEITAKIEKAQRDNDFATLEDLLRQKQEVEREMRRYRE